MPGNPEPCPQPLIHLDSFCPFHFPSFTPFLRVSLSKSVAQETQFEVLLKNLNKDTSLLLFVRVGDACNLSLSYIPSRQNV